MKMDEVVVGLDTDSSGYHWVANKPLWDGTSDEPNKTYAGYIATGAEVESRRSILYTSAKGFFGSISSGTSQPLHVFCEEPLALKNGKTTRILGLAAGAIWAAFVESGGLRRDRYWYWVDVAHWKKEVVGRGNVSKEEIREFVRDNPGWGHLAADTVWPENNTNRFTYDDLFELDHNLYDAWCLKVYGVRQLVGR